MESRRQKSLDEFVKVLSQKDFEARKGFSFLRNVISEGVKIA
jgi:hypothetical protein